MLPPLGRTSPAMQLSVVVLPAPFEPSSATIEPRFTSSETSATPTRSPYMHFEMLDAQLAHLFRQCGGRGRDRPRSRLRP
jgi:hypothetical protein